MPSRALLFPGGAAPRPEPARSPGPDRSADPLHQGPVPGACRGLFQACGFLIVGSGGVEDCPLSVRLEDRLGGCAAPPGQCGRLKG